ncbi:MAG: DUF4136 domain-containing protein [Myxococcales bacterium]|nr:DUF4136 domain-containing protein [Myxococcales bacterium]
MRHLPHLALPHLALPLLALTLLACGPAHEVVVSHPIPPGPQLAQMKSYHLVVTPVDEADRTHWMVERAIHDDLRSKGYVPVDRASADVLVQYETDIRGGGDINHGSAINGSVGGRAAAEKHIAVTITDPRSSTMVFRATAQGEVHPGYLTASVNDALDDILAPIPYRAPAPQRVD